MRFISVGHGNAVSAARVVAVVSPDASPVKRLIGDAKDEGRAIDVTGGRKTKSVLVCDTGHIILCALQTETVTARLNGGAEGDDTGRTAEQETENDHHNEENEDHV